MKANHTDIKIGGAIFDLDGTLLDSMSIWNTAGEKYLLSMGIRPKENPAEACKTMSMQQSANYLRRIYDIEENTEEIIAGINAIIERFYIEEAMLKSGVKELLKELSGKNVKMCIATATDKYLVEKALIRCGVYDYFGKVFTCGEVGHGKDEPEIYERALEYLGTSKENTIVFEDALHAIETAKKAGFIIAGVFDEAEKDQQKVRALSDYYIKDFTEK